MRSRRCPGGMRVLSVRLASSCRRRAITCRVASTETLVTRLTTLKLTITSSLMVVCQMSSTKWDEFLTWEGVLPRIVARISAKLLAKGWMGDLKVKRGIVECLKSRAEKVCHVSRRQPELSHLHGVFTANGYPDHLLWKTLT